MIIPIRWGTATTVYFPLVTAGGTDFQTTWTPGAGEYDYILDGGAVTSLGSAPSHEGNGIWSQALTAAETSGEYLVLSYSDSATDIEDQAIICWTGLSGQVEAEKGIFICEVETAQTAAAADAFEAHFISPTTTIEQTPDHFNGRNILFTSGNLTGSMSDVLDYAFTNSNAAFSVTSFAEIPADGDRFVVL